MPGIRDGDVLLEGCPYVGDGIVEAEALSRLSELDIVAVVEAIRREGSDHQSIAQSEQQVVSLLFPCFSDFKVFQISFTQSKSTRLFCWHFYATQGNLRLLSISHRLTIDSHRLTIDSIASIDDRFNRID